MKNQKRSKLKPKIQGLFKCKRKNILYHPSFQSSSSSRSVIILVTYGPSSPLSISFFSCSLEIAYLWTTPQILPVSLRISTKASKTLFALVKAGSTMMGYGLLCGNERRPLNIGDTLIKLFSSVQSRLLRISSIKFCNKCHLSSSQTR